MGSVYLQYISRASHDAWHIISIWILLNEWAMVFIKITLLGNIHQFCKNESWRNPARYLYTPKRKEIARQNQKEVGSVIFKPVYVKSYSDIIFVMWKSYPNAPHNTWPESKRPGNWFNNHFYKAHSYLFSNHSFVT